MRRREKTSVGIAGGGGRSSTPQFISSTPLVWFIGLSWGQIALVSLASTPPGMPGTHALQYFTWGDVNGNIPTNIIAYVRIYQTNISRPRPMTAFNYVFYSLFCSKIQNLPQNGPKRHWGTGYTNCWIGWIDWIRPHDKEKTLNLAPQNSSKYAIFRSQNKKFTPSHTPPPVRRGAPSPLATPLALLPPNFELALTPLTCIHLCDIIALAQFLSRHLSTILYRYSTMIAVKIENLWFLVNYNYNYNYYAVWPPLL